MSLASERSQRIMAKDIIGDNLAVERGAFTFSLDGGGEEVRSVPFAYVPNVIAKIADLVAAHQR